jgi:hypothetical protein
MSTNGQAKTISQPAFEIGVIVVSMNDDDFDARDIPNAADVWFANHRDEINQAIRVELVENGMIEQSDSLTNTTRK